MIEKPLHISTGQAKVFHLTGPDGKTFPSAIPGTIGGHRKLRIYGRLDCPSALRWLARGHYASQRVFFLNAADAECAGYRPCRICRPGEQTQQGRSASTMSLKQSET